VGDQAYEIRLIKVAGKQKKVWHGCTTPHGIAIKHGIDGRRLRTRYIPPAQIPDGDTDAALEALAAEQVRHGYQLSWHGFRPDVFSQAGGAGQQAEPAQETQPKQQDDQWGIAPPVWF